MEGYWQSVEPIRKWLLLGIAGFGTLAGLSGTAEWSRWMLFRNGGTFGTQDPQFGMDIGFFVFKLPFLRYSGPGSASWPCSDADAGCIRALPVRRSAPAERRAGSEAAQVQISLLLGLICLLKAVAYWLDRFALSLKQEDFVEGFTGLKYRDVEAVLPAKTILTFIALVCAVLFFLNIFRRTWTLPLVGLGLLAVSALVIGGSARRSCSSSRCGPTSPARKRRTSAVTSRPRAMPTTCRMCKATSTSRWPSRTRSP